MSSRRSSFASHIAAASARNGMKAIVFVNVKAHTVSTARETAAVLGQPPQPTPEEAERWNALKAEVGGQLCADLAIRRAGTRIWR